MHPDYHVEIDRHFYSVPYQYVHEQMEARISESTVEIFRHGRRLVTHVRSLVPGKATTYPSIGRPGIAWTPDRLMEKGRTIGPSTGSVIQTVLRSRHN
ncbi:MAG: hypothetical protein EHM23_30040 [Acidobacteria bacterium]|nr:MAG: hypothetical protein EHM23_30040 [Acidobacteriota bacterium]